MKGYARAVIVKIPFAERPLPPMVAGEKENEIVAESFLGEIQDPSHFGIHAFYVRQVTGPVLAGFLGIDKEGRQGHFVGIVVHFLGPLGVGAAIPDQEANGAIDLRLAEILFHLYGHAGPFGVVEVHAFEVPVAVGDFAKRGNVVAHFLRMGIRNFVPGLT